MGVGEGHLCTQTAKAGPISFNNWWGMDVGHESAYDSYNQTNLGLGEDRTQPSFLSKYIISQREAVPRMAYHFKAVKGGRGELFLEPSRTCMYRKRNF